MSPRRVSASRVAPLLLATLLLSLGACSDGSSVGPPLPRNALAGSDLRAYRLGVGDKVSLMLAPRLVVAADKAHSFQRTLPIFEALY